MAISKKGMSFSSTRAALTGLVLLSGCATYSMPGVRLETPEASGREYRVDFEPVGVFSGTDLNTRPTPIRPSAEEGETPPDPYFAAQGTMRYGVGAMASVARKFDVGFRFQPQVPPTLRFKYQFLGEPEVDAPDGNLSWSIVVSPGFKPGSSSYFLADISVPFGYRLSKKHLFWLSPYYTMASVSGLTTSAATQTQSSSTTTTSAATAAGESISPSVLGGGLGYQFGVKYLFLRAEATYILSGSVGETRIEGIGFGGLIGFRLK